MTRAIEMKPLHRQIGRAKSRSRKRPLAVLTVAIGLLLIHLIGQSVQAQFTANSLSSLRSLAATHNNATITLAPGDYWIDGNHISNPTSSMPIFLELGGNNNTYNLTGANLKLDTRDLAGFGRALGHDSGVRVVKVTGSNNTINGLNLAGYDLDVDTDPNARRYADWASVYVQLTGSNNSMNGVDVLTRGSNPYGFGDVFGKGARVFPQGEPANQGGLPWIGHNKTSAFNVFEATGAVVNEMNLQVKTFGHGFFVQKSSDTTLTNSTVTGELFSSNDIIASPKYQEYGFTSHGNELPPDIMISGGEDGVRMYGSIGGVPSVGLTVDNVVVTNMRSAFSTALGFTDLDNGLGITLNNVEAYGAEVGFGLGSLTTLTNAKGDITNGPLIHFPYNNARDTTIDVELVGEVPVGLDYAVAYLNGQRLDVTIESDLPAGALPDDSMARFGQTFFNNWRDTLHPTGPESADPGDFIDSTFVNNTNQMVVLGNLATNNSGSSQAPVISNGKDNAYDGLTRVMAGTHLLLTHTKGLGNNGTADDGTLESNASVVEAGATLELQPGIRIIDEKLTISGVGVDGKGALYSDGTVNTDTRFGSSNGGDESTIFLDGDSAIGVGVAGNQMNVGRIQGAGTLTKLGPGTLTIGKSSTYDGDLVVAEGRVVGRPGVVHRNLFVGFGASIAGIGGNVFNTDGDVILVGSMDLNARTDDNSLIASIGRLYGSGVVVSSNPFAGVGSTLNITGALGQGEFSGTIQDNISIVKTGASTQVLSGNNTYSGTTTINGGTLLVHGSHTGGGDYIINAGTLGGTGAIHADIIVRSGGTLSPGPTMASLNAENVTFEQGSAFHIDISGEGHDLLFTDSASLGGELFVSLATTDDGLYIPTSTESFISLVSGDLAGAFDNVADGERLLTENGEGSFTVYYNSTIDHLRVSGFKITGDFNSNGIVDAADFTVWRDTLGQTNMTPFSGADGDGDGRVTEDDYLAWVENFGVMANALVNLPIANGDFDGDGNFDCTDLDALVSMIASSSDSPAFDLDGDGSVTSSDLDACLSEAGEANLGPGQSYLLADANLDGVVDTSDFNAWNSNKFTASTGWCSGDFNADGVVDISDFNVWNAHKFQSSDAAAVPEPSCIALLLLACSTLFFQRRRRRR